MRRLLQSIAITTVTGLGLLLVSAPAARADLVPAPGTPTVTPLGGGQFAWDYTVQVTSGESVQLFDFFTIYDIGGFVSFQAPAGWAGSAQNIGFHPTTAGGVPVPPPDPDDPDLANVTFQYAQSTPIVGPATVPGVFRIVSTFSGGTLDTFGATVHNQQTGEEDVNFTRVLVPVVPEPGTFALFGVGGLALLGFARRRRKLVE